MSALAKLDGQRAVLARFEKLVNESARIVEVAGKAYKLTRDPMTGAPVQPEGLQPGTRAMDDYHIQRDALQTSKDCPTYLRLHIERVALAQRIAGGGDGSRVPVVNFIQQNFSMPPKYPVIDVTPVDRKG